MSEFPAALVATAFATFGSGLVVGFVLSIVARTFD